MMNGIMKSNDVKVFSFDKSHICKGLEDGFAKFQLLDLRSWRLLTPKQYQPRIGAIYSSWMRLPQAKYRLKQACKHASACLSITKYSGAFISTWSWTLKHNRTNLVKTLKQHLKTASNTRSAISTVAPVTRHLRSIVQPVVQVTHPEHMMEPGDGVFPHTASDMQVTDDLRTVTVALLQLALVRCQVTPHKAQLCTAHM
jgi:hypothetical protein